MDAHLGFRLPASTEVHKELHPPGRRFPWGGTLKSRAGRFGRAAAPYWAALLRRLSETKSLPSTSDLGYGPRLEPAQHSLPWQETPGSSAMRLADNPKERDYFGNGCPGYAIPRCPPPHPSGSVFKAPKEAFRTFKHFVFMKIPRVFLATSGLSLTLNPISQMEKPRNRTSEYSLNIFSKPAKDQPVLFSESQSR